MLIDEITHLLRCSLKKYAAPNVVNNALVKDKALLSAIGRLIIAAIQNQFPSAPAIPFKACQGKKFVYRIFGKSLILKTESKNTPSPAFKKRTC